jgi:Asp-tRNA(Asn)/Glu-tRNA(Gln) amidotransferase A subunit family amidase
VAVPNGPKAGGAPAEICFVGGLFGEANALELANAYQHATTWHGQRPPLP